MRAELKARGRLPPAECVQLGRGLAGALAHLHGHGLVHRDVKPSNIIFVEGVPKLADIGLVADMSDARSFVGTEGFIPPEGPGSPQADLYSLGKVLYEAATGKDRRDFPELPTDCASQTEESALLELNAVIVKACRVDPRERYRTAEEMATDLGLLHHGKSVKRRRVWRRQVRLVGKAGRELSLIDDSGGVPDGYAASPHISWLFGESEAMEAAIQAMCGLDGKPRPLKGTSQTAQVVEVLPDRKRFLSTGSKRFDTFLSIAGRGFLKPGFFMPLKSWFKNPCMHEKSGLGEEVRLAAR